SPRRGTPAADMPDQIDKSVRSERVHRLSQLEDQLRRDYFQSLVGSELEMLVESSRQIAISNSHPIGTKSSPTTEKNCSDPDTVDSASILTNPINDAPTQIQSDKTLLRGTTCRYAPSELIVNQSEGDAFQVGQLIRVSVQQSDGEKLRVTTVLQDSPIPEGPCSKVQGPCSK
ncbi:hypothetical protein OAL43_02445, partial [bacterium]|nr:hypothetical protein [bacterium]